MTEDNSSKVSLESQIEALLFSYGDFLTIKDLQTTLHEESELKIKSALESIKEKFKKGFSFTLIEENNRFKMGLLENYETLASDLISNLEIPAHILRVLSVIAYEQPVSKTRLAEIIGKNVQSEIAYLYRNKFLSYEKVGIGKFYRVTKKFYDYFQLEEDEEFRNTAQSSITTYFQGVEELSKELDIPLEHAQEILDQKKKKKDDENSSIENSEEESHKIPENEE